MQYVIIGNSIAGVAAAKSIRKNDTDGHIIIVGDEGVNAYARPLISYYLNGKTNLKKMEYCEPDFYSNYNIDLLHDSAVKIDKANKEVILESGSKIKYDKVLVATGSSPFVPPTEGYDLVENKYTFLKIADALSIDKVINKESRVLIVGAGLIGLKCAEGIADKVKHIDIIDMAPHVLASILDGEGAKIIEKHIETFNVSLHLGDSVETYTEDSAKLKSGKTLDFDVIVTAVGVRPNVSLVKDAGGEVNRGIIINDKMETTVKDVYSAGDCTEGYDSIKEENRILALLPNASMQGECAGANMSGAECEFTTGMAFNAIGIFGLHIATAGIYEGSTKVFYDGDNYKKIYCNDETMNGYIVIGDVSRAGIYTGIIKNRTPIDEIDFEEICNRPTLTAFPKSTRDEMLGGANNE